MNLFKLIIASLLFLGACKSEPVINDQNLNPSDTGLLFLALGDSYTIGQNVTVDQRWPVLLVKDLKKNGTAVHSRKL